MYDSLTFPFHVESGRQVRLTSDGIPQNLKLGSRRVSFLEWCINSEFDSHFTLITRLRNTFCCALIVISDRECRWTTR